MTDRDTVMREALAVLDGALDAQSNPARADFPTIHDFGAMRRAADAMRACLAEPVLTDSDLMRRALDVLEQHDNPQRWPFAIKQDSKAVRDALRARLTEPVQPVAKVVFRQDDDGLEPVMFCGPGSEPDPSTLKDRFILRDVWLSKPPVQPVAVPVTDAILNEKARLHMQDGHSWRGCWAPEVELVASLGETYYRRGWRECEKFNGTAAAPKGGA